MQAIVNSFSAGDGRTSRADLCRKGRCERVCVIDSIRKA